MPVCSLSLFSEVTDDFPTRLLFSPSVASFVDAAAATSVVVGDDVDDRKEPKPEHHNSNIKKKIFRILRCCGRCRRRR